MKLQAITLTAFLATVTIPDDAVAYNMYSAGPRRGNNCRPRGSFSNRDSFSSSPRFNGPRGRRDRVEEAFRELQNEMNGGPRRSKKAGQFDFMMMDPTTLDFQDVDQEAVKKWVDKAFALASEFNQDFSKSDKERETNDEFLEKSRQWVENMYTPPDVSKSGAASDGTTPSASATEQESVAPSDKQDSSTPQPPQEPEILTPYSENRSDEEVFMVAVDLPGVERSAVDLTLENDFLVIEAERGSEDDEEILASRKYVKKFALIEDEIEVGQIVAALDNGVLTVSAPKKKREETKIKIPLV
ncbi:MAG: hypothetical protein SGILL_003248 [Bacillariaceae sp.]